MKLVSCEMSGCETSCCEMSGCEMSYQNIPSCEMSGCEMSCHRIYTTVFLYLHIQVPTNSQHLTTNSLDHGFGITTGNERFTQLSNSNFQNII